MSPVLFSACRLSRSIWVFLVLLSACGCAGLNECCRGIAGTSTKILNDNRPSAVSRDFACGRQECAARIEEIIREMESYVYRREGDLIAVYVSEQDTTPVGIYLTGKGEDKTGIEISSPSTYARERISRQLYASLEKKLKSKKIEVQLDAVEGRD